MLAINEFQSRYLPLANFVGNDIKALFSTVRVENHLKNSPENDGSELWINLPEWHGKSVYVTPCQQLKQLIESVNIYGTPKYKDVYLKVDNNRLSMVFQQIIGGYCLIDLTNKQMKILNELQEA